MPTREDMMRVVEDLPEDASIDEAVERLYLLEKIERGIAQADAGHTVSHEEARRRLSRWLK
jgi:predicted transcriptional regulator